MDIIDQWFRTKGKRMVELKLKGGRYIFKGNFKKAQQVLTDGELCEFLILSGQFDMLIWAFAPKDKKEYDNFMKEIEKQFTQIESILEFPIQKGSA